MQLLLLFCVTWEKQFEDSSIDNEVSCRFLFSTDLVLDYYCYWIVDEFCWQFLPEVLFHSAV